MPVITAKDKIGCFARFGEQGKKYYYTCGNLISRKNARKKAVAQGVNMGEFAIEKISFDFDSVLDKKKYQDMTKSYIKQGVAVYVISARHHTDKIYEITDKLNIPRSRVYATGSNAAKIQKIHDLNISTHYDNNENIINKLDGKGRLVKLTMQEKINKILNFLSNDTIRS